MRLQGARLFEPATQIVSDAQVRTLRPGAADDGSSFVSENRPFAKREHANDEVEYDSWLRLAREGLVDGLAMAREIPESATAQLNVVQLALQCGDKAAATEAAFSAIPLLERDYRDHGIFDSAAPRILAQAFIGTGSPKAVQALAAYVSGLADVPSAQMVLADIQIDSHEYLQAIETLRTIDGPRARVLRGYCQLQLGDARGSIASLRGAIRQHPDDPDACILLSWAFRTTGAHRRALQYAVRAARIAPGRHDVSIRMLNMMVDAHRVKEARVEVQLIKSKHVVETVDFLVVQARIELTDGNIDRAVAILRQAQALAVREGSDQVAIELTTHLTLMRSVDARRVERVRIVRDALKRAPRSEVLINMLADSLRRTSEAGILRAAIDAAEEDPSQTDLLGAKVALAHLELDFDSALSLSATWASADPFNSTPAAVAVMLTGLLSDDWTRAASIAKAALAASPHGEGLYNNAAYAMALSGDPTQAIALLDRSTRKDAYQLVATRGLAKIASGAVMEGLRLYREAARLADLDPERDDRALMTLHQEMALRRLGIDPNESIAVEASSLPAPSLPVDWRTIPEFVLLQRVALRHGWPWPDSP